MLQLQKLSTSLLSAFQLYCVFKMPVHRPPGGVNMTECFCKLSYIFHLDLPSICLTSQLHCLSYLWLDWPWDKFNKLIQTCKFRDQVINAIVPLNIKYFIESL